MRFNDGADGRQRLAGGGLAVVVARQQPAFNPGQEIVVDVTNLVRAFVDLGFIANSVVAASERWEIERRAAAARAGEAAPKVVGRRRVDAARRCGPYLVNRRRNPSTTMFLRLL